MIDEQGNDDKGGNANGKTQNIDKVNPLCSARFR